ncbi:hypothetical protein [Hymenobacter rubripertinctus]|uniref:hypothetical protein n=1 Tax=Hymenobacter rubripertinctus TaxID=2029981 RepID=UPI0011C3595A|nr:hypothetical protein [Hymenobacter rubripertinctus]
MITLENLVNDFLYEPHKFFKYSDLNGNSLNKEFRFDNYEHYLQEYLGFFKNESNLKDVLSYACCGVFKISRNNQTFLIRHNHQEYFKGTNGSYRGLPLEDGKIIARLTHERLNDIKKVENFDDLHNIIKECSEVNAKFGQLSIYDAAIRTGSFLGIKPDFVYIHTGVRAGVTVLEELGYTKEQLSNRLYAPLKDFPVEMHIMTEIGAENFSCTDKDRFKKLPPKGR